MHRGHSRLRTQSENWKYLLEVVNRSALVSATIVDSFISMDKDLSEIVKLFWVKMGPVFVFNSMGFPHFFEF